MTTEPFEAHPGRDETIAAADAGPGAPPPAEGFGIGGEEPDTGGGQAGTPGDPTAPGAEQSTGARDDVPFRTPDPDDVRRTP